MSSTARSITRCATAMWPRRSRRSPSISKPPGRISWERRRSDAIYPARWMNPGLLGLIAAIAWGVHDVIGARLSASLGPVKTATAVTVFGLLLLSLWMSMTGAFPSAPAAQLWLPLISGVLLALATLWLFAA